MTETASNALMYIVVILLGTSVGATTTGAEHFLNVATLKIVVLGLVAFAFGTAAGVLFGKLMCLVTGGKINPLIGSAGVSAVPMAAQCIPESWCRSRSDELPFDACNGSKRSRCYRYCGCSRCVYGDLMEYKEDIEIMAEIKKKPIKITETILRDAHQSSDCDSYDNRTDASDCR